ncbi:MAG TPA: universal stress protein [Oleiagrimonas sp.]|nr:universal stress protein [Oleiagrimonas sp.]
MGQDHAHARPPRRILLATDLSSHCDRALDRAVQLAGRWKATLHVVHALRPETGTGAWWAPGGGEPQAGEAQIALIERQIRRDMPVELNDLEIHVDVGEPVDVILRTAEREGCDLIVTGANGPTFASIIIHTTTEHLLRRAPQSLLIVKARPHGVYRQVLVGTDFTAESRHGLETAATWFAEADFTLMHALDIPYRSMFLEAGREDAFARLEHETMESFVASARLPEAVRGRVATRIAYGYPEAMLSEHGLAHDVDLTVIGALARGLVFHMLMGGNAARIVQTVPGDVLMVRSRTAAAEA